MSDLFVEEGYPFISFFGSFGVEDPFIGKESFTEEDDPVIGIGSYGEEDLFIGSFGF